jgi:hypothetical protein
MPILAHPSRLAVTAACLGLLACREQPDPIAPEPDVHRAQAAPLSEDDEALLASLVAEDPGDFHVERARIWRVGPARWVEGGPELPGRPPDHALDRPLEAVVVDRAGPRVLLPLAQLDDRPEWSSLRIVAVLGAGDLVAGLRRELRPTPWLTLAAGVGLTPRGRSDGHLDVGWSDPACGFGLHLAIDTEDFGPLYEPGPAGPPSDTPEPPDAAPLRLAPGTAIFATADAREPVLRLDPQPASHGERLSAAQRVTLDGKPTRGRQAVTLRCRGVEVRGFVTTDAIVENPARYAVVDHPPPPTSTCAGFGSGEPLIVPRATPLREPTGDGRGALIGVVAADLELAATPGPEGWWTGCVASPWGDLVFQFRLR